MDKEVTKRLLHAAGLPVVPWALVRSGALRRDPDGTCRRVLSELAAPLFVKPANLGSSVGISHVESGDQLGAALAEASRYDDKILVERAVAAREIEVALLGNDPIEASVPGEIRTGHDFYDYEAKYVDEDTELFVPAPVSDAQSAELQRLAIAAVEVVEGRGLARVDFLMDRHNDEIFVNEVNSLPGFTEGSMYPKLWEATGLSYPALIDRLLELALERHRERSKLETLYRRT
jgi:D-alanine-D-alanine ligase